MPLPLQTQPLTTEQIKQTTEKLHETLYSNMQDPINKTCTQQQTKIESMGEKLQQKFSSQQSQWDKYYQDQQSQWDKYQQDQSRKRKADEEDEAADPADAKRLIREKLFDRHDAYGKQMRQERNDAIAAKEKAYEKALNTVQGFATSSSGTF